MQAATAQDEKSGELPFVLAVECVANRVVFSGIKQPAQWGMYRFPARSSTNKIRFLPVKMQGRSKHAGQWRDFVPSARRKRDFAEAASSAAGVDVYSEAVS